MLVNKIIASLKSALLEQATEAMALKPSDGNAAYLFGRVQGEYIGLSSALSIIENILDDQDEDFDAGAPNANGR